MTKISCNLGQREFHFFLASKKLVITFLTQHVIFVGRKKKPKFFVSFKNITNLDL